MTDEELQDNIEKGNIFEGPDARAYMKVFESLRREPSFRLSPDFSKGVIQRINFSSRQSYRDMIWLYLGLASCVVAMFIAVIMTDFKISLGAFRFIAGYPGLFVFALFFILALQWIDKKIVRKMTT